MRPSRAITFWSLVIAILVLLEVAEVTHLFTLGIVAVLSDPLAFIFAIFLITILALVGALFVGIYVAHRILSPGSFTPFETEMLKMRGEIHDLTKKVETLVEKEQPKEEPK